jgi:hypothetical protein
MDGGAQIAVNALLIRLLHRPRQPQSPFVTDVVPRSLVPSSHQTQSKCLIFAPSTPPFSVLWYVRVVGVAGMLMTTMRVSLGLHERHRVHM